MNEKRYLAKRKEFNDDRGIDSLSAQYEEIVALRLAVEEAEAWLRETGNKAASSRAKTQLRKADSHHGTSNKGRKLAAVRVPR